MSRGDTSLSRRKGWSMYKENEDERDDLVGIEGKRLGVGPRKRETSRGPRGGIELR